METNSLNNLRVAVYARVSTEEQKEGQTIDSQIAELERYAREKRWHIVGVYKDEGWSGSLLARPSLDQLRDDASKGLFNGVLINDVDRLARDVAHLGVIKRDLERHGQQVVFRKLPTENSPTHNLMVNILGSFAEFEREMIVDRTRRGRRHKVEVRKEFLGSIPPYGLRYVQKDPSTGSGGSLEINPAEADVVRRMYRWVDEEGLSARRVVDHLNELHLPPRKGNTAWAKSSVLRILRSEVYAGTWHYLKHEACVPRKNGNTPRYTKTPKSSQRLRVRSEWLPVELPRTLQIIDRDQWVRVQRQLDRNFAFSPRNEKHQYLLKGLVRCAACGARMVGQPCHGKFYYRCMARCKQVPSILEQRLNHAVWRTVTAAIQRPSLIANQLAKLKRNKASTSGNGHDASPEIREAIQQIQKEEGRIIEAYRLSVLSPAQLAQELEGIRARKDQIESLKARIDKKKAALSQEVMKRSIKDYCRMVAPRLKALTLDGRQHFLRVLIQGIVYDGETARIKGALPVSTGRKEVASSATPQNYRQIPSGNIAPIASYPYESNAPLYSGPFGATSGDRDRNMPGDELAGFGRIDPEARIELPFELVCSIPRLPHSRPLGPRFSGNSRRASEDEEPAA